MAQVYQYVAPRGQLSVYNQKYLLVKSDDAQAFIDTDRINSCIDLNTSCQTAWNQSAYTILSVSDCNDLAVIRQVGGDRCYFAKLLPLTILNEDVTAQSEIYYFPELVMVYNRSMPNYTFWQYDGTALNVLFMLTPGVIQNITRDNSYISFFSDLQKMFNIIYMRAAQRMIISITIPNQSGINRPYQFNYDLQFANNRMIITPIQGFGNLLNSHYLREAGFSSDGRYAVMEGLNLVNFPIVPNTPAITDFGGSQIIAITKYNKLIVKSTDYLKRQITFSLYDIQNPGVAQKTLIFDNSSNNVRWKRLDDFYLDSYGDDSAYPDGYIQNMYINTQSSLVLTFDPLSLGGSNTLPADYIYLNFDLDFVGYLPTPVNVQELPYSNQMTWFDSGLVIMGNTDYSDLNVAWLVRKGLSLNQLDYFIGADVTQLRANMDTIEQLRGQSVPTEIWQNILDYF